MEYKSFKKGEIVSVCHRNDVGEIIRAIAYIIDIQNKRDPYYVVGESFGYWLSADPEDRLWIEKR